MNIFSFTAHFGSEEDCRLHFKEQRDKEGVVCKRCGGTSHYPKSVIRIKTYHFLMTAIRKTVLYILDS